MWASPCVCVWLVQVCFRRETGHAAGVATPIGRGGRPAICATRPSLELWIQIVRASQGDSRFVLLHSHLRYRVCHDMAGSLGQESAVH